jgi:hypothetical protein
MRQIFVAKMSSRPPAGMRWNPNLVAAEVQQIVANDGVLPSASGRLGARGASLAEYLRDQPADGSSGGGSRGVIIQGVSDTAPAARTQAQRAQDFSRDTSSRQNIAAVERRLAGLREAARREARQRPSVRTARDAYAAALEAAQGGR